MRQWDFYSVDLHWAEDSKKEEITRIQCWATGKYTQKAMFEISEEQTARNGSSNLKFQYLGDRGRRIAVSFRPSWATMWDSTSKTNNNNTHYPKWKRGRAAMRDGWADKACKSKFDSQNLHVGKSEVSPSNCPLIPTRIHTQTQQTNKSTNK